VSIREEARVKKAQRVGSYDVVLTFIFSTHCPNSLPLLSNPPSPPPAVSFFFLSSSSTTCCCFSTLSLSSLSPFNFSLFSPLHPFPLPLLQDPLPLSLLLLNLSLPLPLLLFSLPKLLSMRLLRRWYRGFDGLPEQGVACVELLTISEGLGISFDAEGGEEGADL
jgi:hypothetical protein